MDVRMRIRQKEYEELITRTIEGRRRNAIMIKYNHTRNLIGYSAINESKKKELLERLQGAEKYLLSKNRSFNKLGEALASAIELEYLEELVIT